MVMDRIEVSGNDKLAACFHHYLLILGLFNRFLVQQTNQYGFDQFQKITVNSFRDVPEKQYERRFFQLHGNDSLNLAVLEGRFAPKITAVETIRLVRQIVRGWEHFTDNSKYNSPRDKPQLRLVCHFIKETDKNKLDDKNNLPSLLIRHRNLRIMNWRKAQALLQAYDEDETVRQFLCGIDAASNELEAPPEVFSPVYRYLRRKGLRHFTYHAGEDFHHLIGGLRAMFEAVVFLDLRRGDRIGHGTAAGIDPELWLDCAGEELVMSQGEWLDDLLFAVFLIEKTPAAGLNSKLPLLHSTIAEVAHDIYRENFTTHNCTMAWLARRFCPFHLLYDADESMGMTTWSRDEWLACELVRQDNEVMALLKLYHQADCRLRYHRKVKIRSTRLFSADDLRQLQNILLADLHQHEIVLEVLPTSNVRISHYKDLSEHHLWRWLDLKKDKQSFSNFPPVVIGTDDTGIFSTNIYNEYSQIYHQLIRTHKLEYDQAAKVIQGIVENGKVYGFGVN